MTTSKRAAVYDRINAERTHQEACYPNRSHSVGAWLTILRKELREAEDAWCDSDGSEDALYEILQVAAVAVACLEQNLR